MARKAAAAATRCDPSARLLALSSHISADGAVAGGERSGIAPACWHLLGRQRVGQCEWRRPRAVSSTAIRRGRPATFCDPRSRPQRRRPQTGDSPCRHDAERDDGIAGFRCRCRLQAADRGPRRRRPSAERHGDRPPDFAFERPATTTTTANSIYAQRELPPHYGAAPRGRTARQSRRRRGHDAPPSRGARVRIRAARRRQAPSTAAHFHGRGGRGFGCVGRGHRRPRRAGSPWSLPGQRPGRRLFADIAGGTRPGGDYQGGGRCGPADRELLVRVHTRGTIRSRSHNVRVKDIKRARQARAAGLRNGSSVRKPPTSDDGPVAMGFNETPARGRDRFRVQFGPDSTRPPGPATVSPPPRQWRQAAVAQRACAAGARHHDR